MAQVIHLRVEADRPGDASKVIRYGRHGAMSDPTETGAAAESADAGKEQQPKPKEKAPQLTKMWIDDKKPTPEAATEDPADGAEIVEPEKAGEKPDSEDPAGDAKPDEGGKKKEPATPEAEAAAKKKADDAKAAENAPKLTESEKKTEKHGQEIVAQGKRIDAFQSTLEELVTELKIKNDATAFAPTEAQQAALDEIEALDDDQVINAEQLKKYLKVSASAGVGQKAIEALSARVEALASANAKEASANTVTQWAVTEIKTNPEFEGHTDTLLGEYDKEMKPFESSVNAMDDAAFKALSDTMLDKARTTVRATIKADEKVETDAKETVEEPGKKKEPVKAAPANPSTDGTKIKQETAQSLNADDVSNEEEYDEYGHAIMPKGMFVSDSK